MTKSDFIYWFAAVATALTQPGFNPWWKWLQNLLISHNALNTHWLLASHNFQKCIEAMKLHSEASQWKITPNSTKTRLKLILTKCPSSLFFEHPLLNIRQRNTAAPTSKLNIKTTYFMFLIRYVHIPLHWSALIPEKFLKRFVTGNCKG